MTENKLDVYYHNRHVGTLAEMPDKRVAFQYAQSWLNEGFPISPFSLPLKNDVFIPKEGSRDIFSGLFGVFADSLPDSWGNLLLDKYLMSIGIKKESVSTLDRLAYIGESGMGALEYRPCKKSDYSIDVSGIDYDKIASECEKILTSKPSDQLDMLYNLAGSSGGTRPKVLLSENGKDWIVKFPASNDPSICGKREYDYSLCAKKCGINMTETGLIKSSVCEGYFKTERFDRIVNHKKFVITFSGLLETDYRAPSCDYDTFMKAIRVLTRDNKEDVMQMFKIMCFNVLTHNLDDHTKNFSFVYDDERQWRLAPAYDITYSDTYWGEHTTSVNGKGKDITDADLIKVGTNAGLSQKKCSELLDEIKENIKDLDIYLNHKPKRKSGKVKPTDRMSELSAKEE